MAQDERSTGFVFNFPFILVLNKAITWVNTGSRGILKLNALTQTAGLLRSYASFGEKGKEKRVITGCRGIL